MTNKVSECIHGIFPREYRDINLPVDASQGVSLSNDPPGLLLAVPVVVKRHAGEAVYASTRVLLWPTQVSFYILPLITVFVVPMVANK